MTGKGNQGNIVRFSRIQSRRVEYKARHIYFQDIPAAVKLG